MSALDQEGWIWGKMELLAWVEFKTAEPPGRERMPARNQASFPNSQQEKGP